MREKKIKKKKKKKLSDVTKLLFFNFFYHLCMYAQILLICPRELNSAG
jgi:hypothetical protein